MTTTNDAAYDAAYGDDEAHYAASITPGVGDAVASQGAHIMRGLVITDPDPVTGTVRVAWSDGTTYDEYPADVTPLGAATRDDILRAYSIDPTYPDTVVYSSYAVAVERRMNAVRCAGRRAGLLDAGPAYSRSFASYCEDAAHAWYHHGAAETDRWVAYAAYVLARTTGTDTRPTTDERRAVQEGADNGAQG